MSGGSTTVQLAVVVDGVGEDQAAIRLAAAVEFVGEDDQQAINGRRGTSVVVVAFKAAIVSSRGRVRDRSPKAREI